MRGLALCMCWPSQGPGCAVPALSHARCVGLCRLDCRLLRRAPEEAPAPVVALIQRCLSEDPAQRPTAVECVQTLTRIAEP